MRHHTHDFEALLVTASVGFGDMGLYFKIIKPAREKCENWLWIS